MTDWQGNSHKKVSDARWPVKQKSSHQSARNVMFLLLHTHPLFLVPDSDFRSIAPDARKFVFCSRLTSPKSFAEKPCVRVAFELFSCRSLYARVDSVTNSSIGRAKTEPSPTSRLPSTVCDGSPSVVMRAKHAFDSMRQYSFP